MEPFDWVEIPAGMALLGVDPEPSRANGADPGRVVDVGAFALARTPVTNAQYARFVAATGRPAPSHWEGPRPPGSLVDHPVTYVDHEDALAFCDWAGVRLPTEVEWEKAARGTDGRRYPWGDRPPTPREVNGAGWFGGTTAVGSLPRGVSPFGVLDMSGNAWEWTASLAPSSPDGPDDLDRSDGLGHPDDPRQGRAAPGRRVLRGGSFRHDAPDLRCAARDALHPDARDEYIGFRVARDRPGATTLPFDWVEVPAGPFRMGEDGPDQNEHDADVVAGPGLAGPRHQVLVARFRISRVPVTNARYAAYVLATGARPPGHWEGRMPPTALLDHPVTYVDWADARAFCAWASVRLPTEAEWERAAAGPEGRAYPWGEATPDATTAWFRHPEGGTRTAGERPAGGTVDGVLDLAGNVWEWTSSLHRAYPYRSDDGREDPDAAGQRVLRGGSFRSPSTDHLRTAFRSRSYPARRRDHIGFRVARA